jgi:hypothetical protein
MDKKELNEQWGSLSGKDWITLIQIIIKYCQGFDAIHTEYR